MGGTATLRYSNSEMTAYWCQEMCRGNQSANFSYAAVVGPDCHCLLSDSGVNPLDTTCEVPCSISPSTLCSTSGAGTAAVYDISAQPSFGESCLNYFQLGFKNTQATFRLQDLTYISCMSLGKHYFIYSKFHE